ncbi:pyridoxal-dependent decarboxylase [Ciceribacter sp. RN22]|uniref:pyridoxal-dependent decarboxylase n=1 Tax=Ciceribacter sp. RN22 TaxID=2954932 RepID=UPI002092B98D|nr:pyridoxal-dependent decarboxylase [Ciceribacter sp. RN22]MCO6180904.1 pyridoxal-dependent decarboxylase [Ciceribacter sp. RN22]
MSVFDLRHEEFTNSDKSIMTKVERLASELHGRSEEFLGYQFNSVFDYSALSPFLNVHLNNLGDPFSSGCKTIGTRRFEQIVLDMFADLWNAEGRHPLVPDSYWGYVLSMGSTEGTMFALWNARDYLSGKPLLHETIWPTEKMPEPVIFCSQDTHYSVTKCASLLNMATFHELGSRRFPGECPVTEDGSWPLAVASNDGSIDPLQLAELVKFFLDRGHPPVIVLTVGTTFKGAYDDPGLVWQALQPVLDRSGLSLGAAGDRQAFWIHIDGALGGGYLPFLEKARGQGLVEETGPIFDFRLPYVCSIVTSSHKWFGAPFPGGVYMSKEKFRLRPPSRPDYIASADTTFAGSRNGLSALILWYALMTRPTDNQVRDAAYCSRLAEYGFSRLLELNEKMPFLNAQRSPNSLALRFARPRSPVFSRFGLSGEGDQAHIYVMPHVKQELLDRFFDVLSSPSAFVRRPPV